MDYLIIGTSAAGISAIEAIRTRDRTGNITAVTEEDYALYSRCLLSYLLAGKIPEEKLKYREDDFFVKNDVTAVKGRKVVEILKNGRIKLSDGNTLPFDKLLIASGSSSKMEEIPGMGKNGVFGLRNISDARKIESRLPLTKKAVMLGGGLIGLRAAYALHQRGVKVTIVVKSGHVLSQMLDPDAAMFIQKEMSEKGIRILTGLSAREILGDKEAAGVLLENNEKIDCQMVIIGKGVIPNTGFLGESGIKTGYGILTDDYLMTSVKDIYAAGDVAQVQDLLTGTGVINALWPNAVMQGRAAGLNMAGEKRKYDGSVSMNSVEFFGLPVISWGITKPREKEFEVLMKTDGDKKTYRKLVLRDNRIVGLVLVNDIDKAGVYASLLLKKTDISGIKNKLLDDKFNFAALLPVVETNKEKYHEKEYKELLDQLN